MFYAIAVSKSVFYVIRLWWFYVAFRYIIMTSQVARENAKILVSNSYQITFSHID